MFKDSFKYYKSRDPPPDLDAVIDLKNPDLSKVRKISPVAIEEEQSSLGLKSTEDWNIYEIIAKPGLIFIENPFTSAGQRYWITRCVKDYSKKPNKTNLDLHQVLSENENWWDVCSDNVERAKVLLPKLRWATLGYHHNWDTKVYSENFKGEMPDDMVDLTEYLARISGLCHFKAESAIINYYRMNSTLSGHTDKSEIDYEAPLFSVSFGQTGIFLVGGLSLEDPADALLLRSGDVVVMSKGSRLRYHGVPKILQADSMPWKNQNSTNDCKSKKMCIDWDKIMSYISESRVNMNVRQVLRPGQVSLDDKVL
ncbi:nucleic acid dioxygenase ALKBH1 [Neodiprion pinetum]|uniref:nucleic acid dioxygenase ALKBH1 n=1 Tax=Neodiprion pinetum TaxID=441929 RepID=UPI001EDCD54C|nr:nucleic acid dioxygenase ALKBH1 [Neodiprion pinetum]